MTPIFDSSIRRLFEAFADRAMDALHSGWTLGFETALSTGMPFLILANSVSLQTPSLLQVSSTSKPSLFVRPESYVLTGVAIASDAVMPLTNIL